MMNAGMKNLKDFERFVFDVKTVFIYRETRTDIYAQQNRAITIKVIERLECNFSICIALVP